MRTPLERLRDSVTKDNLWLYVLSLLSGRDMYPYEIGREIERNFSFKPGNMTAYLVLQKLEMGGYVRLDRRLVQGGPERQYYRITEKGLDELKRGKAEIRKWAEKFGSP